MDGKTKICAECNQEKHVSGFYKIPYSGNPERNCMVCKRKLSKQHHALSRNKSGNVNEVRIIATLRSMGIYAVTGKSSEFNRADIVAWGCVRIELKSSSENKDGYYHFGFTPKQRDGGLQADVIAIDSMGAYPVAVFPAWHPVFYKPSGKLKQVFAWKPRMRHTKSRIGETVLNDTLMREYAIRWEIIEEVRQQRIQQMIEGGEFTIDSPKVRSLQMGLDL